MLFVSFEFSSQNSTLNIGKHRCFASGNVMPYPAYVERRHNYNYKVGPGVSDIRTNGSK